MEMLGNEYDATESDIIEELIQVETDLRFC